MQKVRAFSTFTIPPMSSFPSVKCDHTTTAFPCLRWSSPTLTNGFF
uniref:Uncharacterized protein n=1 Tax=Arundo donax TaxID=35708 RepID=A0A0A8ZEC3_ARUDO